MIPFVHIPVTDSGNDKDQTSTCFENTIELYEIANHVTQYQQLHRYGNRQDSLGLPPLFQAREPFDSISQLDACIDKWEQRLPQHLRYGHLPSDASQVSHMQSAYLRLR
jgi:hypothetical protein